jgi:hypothetical protein
MGTPDSAVHSPHIVGKSLPKGHNIFKYETPSLCDTDRAVVLCRSDPGHLSLQAVFVTRQRVCRTEWLSVSCEDYFEGIMFD